MLQQWISRHPASAEILSPWWTTQTSSVTPSTCGDDGSVLAVGVLAESMRAAVSGMSADQSLRTVLGLALDIAPCDQASITMLNSRAAVRTVASSDDRVIRADYMQYQLAEGPCLDAAGTDEMIVVEDLTSDRRWPRWSPLAAAMNFGALVTVHLHTDTGLGTLNLYSDHRREYDELDVAAAKVVAAIVSVTVAHIRAGENMKLAIESYSLIGQAQGILMARFRLTSEQALDVLKRHSQTNNIRMTALASELISAGHIAALERLAHQTRQRPSPQRLSKTSGR